MEKLLPQQKVSKNGKEKRGAVTVNLSQHNPQSTSTCHRKIIHRRNISSAKQCRDISSPASASTSHDSGDTPSLNKELQTPSLKRKRSCMLVGCEGKVAKTCEEDECSVRSAQSLQLRNSKKATPKFDQINIPISNKESTFEYVKKISKTPAHSNSTVQRAENNQTHGPERNASVKLDEASSSAVKNRDNTNSKARGQNSNLESRQSKKNCSGEAKHSSKRQIQEKHHWCDMSGTLVALSHIFQMSTCKLYLAQFYLDEDCPNPLLEFRDKIPDGLPVRFDSRSIIAMVFVHHTVPSWRPLLKFGVRYSIRHAKPVMILKNPARLAVLKVYPSSVLTRITSTPSPSSKENCPQGETEGASGTSALSLASGVAKFIQDEGWFTYKGVVSKVINSNLGLYELDEGQAILVLSHLMGFVDDAKYWRSSLDGKDAKPGSLAVGSSVVVQRPHIAKLPSGKMLITCCGRSLVTLKRKKGHGSMEVKSAALDAVMHHSLQGFHWLLWLADLEQLMCLVLSRLGLPPHLVTRHSVHDGRPSSPLSRLLQHWSDRASPACVPRSFVEEFCSSKHALCAATRGLAQKFVAPFEILDAAAVEEKEREMLERYASEHGESIGDSNSKYWDTVITHLGLLSNDDCDLTSNKKSCAQTNADDGSLFMKSSHKHKKGSDHRGEWNTDSVILCRLHLTSSGELNAVLEDDLPTPKESVINDGSSLSQNISEILSIVNCENQSENEGQSPSGLQPLKSGPKGQSHFGPSLESTFEPCLQKSLESSYQGTARTSYPVEIVGRKCHVDPSITEKIVALFNPVLVTEVFKVFMDTATNPGGCRTVNKRYLMVNGKDILKIYDDYEGQEQNSSDVNQGKRGQRDSISIAKNSSPLKASSEVAQGSKKEAEYLVKVSGKLNRMVLTHAVQHQTFNEELMFLCRATVTQKNQFRHENILPQKFHPVSNPKDRQQLAYLRFKGQQQLPYFCSLSDVCEMRVTVPSESTCFTKTTAHRWLPPLTGNGVRAAVCIDVPENAVISEVSHTYAKDEISVPDACRGNYVSGCLLTVVGIIKKRYHMTSAYASQRMDLSEACDLNDIGVPGCKIIRLLLEDDKCNDSTVSQVNVYFSLKSNWLVGKYPRGLIEGVRVKISGVSVSKSSKTNVTYISAKLVSIVQVLSLPPLPISGRDTDSNEHQNYKPNFKFLHEIAKEFVSLIYNPHSLANTTAFSLIEPSCAPEESKKVHPILQNAPASVSAVPIKEAHASRSSFKLARVIANVTRLVKLCLSLQCPDCSAELSASGSCSYVGCHSSREPVLSVGARLVVEDGLSQAYVIIKNEEHVRTLLGIPCSRWAKLTSTLMEIRLPLTYLPRAKSKLGYVDPESLLHDEPCTNFGGDHRSTVVQVCTQIVHNYVSTGALYRPLLLTLRPMKPSLDYADQWKGVMSCYCLHLSDVVPENAVELFDKHTHVK